LNTNSAFLSLNYNFVLPFLQMTTSDLSVFRTEICQRWKCSVIPGVHPVLVCTDDVLPELDVSDAMWLIHYSLPHTKTGFGFRFACLMKNYPNMFQKSTSVSVTLVSQVYIKLCFKEDQITGRCPFR
jgi:hypothetical protein